MMAESMCQVSSGETVHLVGQLPSLVPSLAEGEGSSDGRVLDGKERASIKTSMADDDLPAEDIAGNTKVVEAVQIGTVDNPIKSPEIGTSTKADTSEAMLPQLEANRDEAHRNRETILENSSPGETLSTSGKPQLAPSSSETSVVRVRYCDWERFKNRFSKDEAVHVIEALTVLDSRDLDDQIEREQMKRIPGFVKHRFDTEWTNAARRNVVEDDLADIQGCIERIRINSLHIRSFLARVTGEKTLNDKPHVFLRPFRFLIHHHEKLEVEFQAFEKNIRPNLPAITLSPSLILPQAATSLHSEQKTAAPSTHHQGRPTSGIEGDPAGDHRSGGDAETTAFEHIKCYMDFARTRLVAPYHFFEKLDYSQRPKIRYQDLWSLFRMGELVFETVEKSNADPEGPNTDNHKSGPNQQKEEVRLWRVCSVIPQGIDWVVSTPYSPDQLRRASKSKSEDLDFQIYAYQIDWNGDSYAAEEETFSFEPFDGEKEISQLLLYPVRFHPDADKIIDRLEARGKSFQSFLSKGCLAMEYDGWTLSRNPGGWLIKDKDGKAQGREYISSDIIIDFKEAFNAHPSWEPSFGKYGPERIRPVPIDSRSDWFYVEWWATEERSERVKQLTDIVVVDDNIRTVELADLSKTDDFIFDSAVITMRTSRAARTAEKTGAHKQLTRCDLALLPGRMFAYSLKDRKFINANLDYIKEPKTMRDPFGELQMSDEKKHLIRATVQGHLERKMVERYLKGEDVESLEQDFIRHKGKGLVFLLHGAPGTGKTATAEAVAYAHKKPLYSLGCGDLGTDPSTVETNLSEIFRLANLWDCVLLLDEADIFLSHREKTDDNLQRNALVSIFLRTMEYYPGILFLTTNRVGVLDEALSSRIHLSLSFPNLDQRTTLKLVQMNIKRCAKMAEQRASIPGEPKLDIKTAEIKKFARAEFKKYHSRNPPEPWWNGRLIRNAFQVAMSLAYVEPPHDYHAQRTDIEIPDSTPSGQVVTKTLGIKHFEQVRDVFDEFKIYRRDVLMSTDQEFVLKRRERYDFQNQEATRDLGYGDPGHYGTPAGQGSRQYPRSNRSPARRRSDTGYTAMQTPPSHKTGMRGQQHLATPGRYEDSGPGIGRSPSPSVQKPPTHNHYEEEDDEDEEEDDDDEDL